MKCKGYIIRYALFVLTLAFLAGCGRKRTERQTDVPADESRVTEENAQKPYTAEEVVDVWQAETCVTADTVERRVVMQMGSHEINGVIRHVAGEKIWINVSLLGITFARAMFTQDSLMYYERLKKTSYIGTWDDLHNLHGGFTMADYDMVENLMFARPLYDLKAKDLMEQRDDMYIFSRRVHHGIQCGVGVDIHSGRIITQYLTSEDKGMTVTAEYAYDGNSLRETHIVVKAENYAFVKFIYGEERKTHGDFMFKMPQGYRSVMEIMKDIGAG